MKRMIYVLSCLLLSACLAPQFAAAHDPADGVYQNCVQHLRQAVTRCNRANAETTRECVHKIKRLLADGQREAARRVAADCIKEIETRTERCDDAIRTMCRRCIDRLLELGAEELAKRLRHQCSHALRSIHQVEARSIHAIKELFDRD